MPLYMEENLNLPVKQILNIIQNRITTKSTYFGVKAAKNPLDAWIYQEILFETKPDVIIEIGNLFGGGALALAHFCDILGKGKVIGLDIDHSKISPVVRKHLRITLMQGDACALYDKVLALISPEDKVLVIEDSSHTYENTFKVLRTYSPLIKPGLYMIVEDSICHHGLDVGPAPGPYEAIERFVAENENFIIDRSKEEFLITWNPKGYLKRIQ
jgi:cephalosporin hydroxylase